MPCGELPNDASQQDIVLTAQQTQDVDGVETSRGHGGCKQSDHKQDAGVVADG